MYFYLTASASVKPAQFVVVYFITTKASHKKKNLAALSEKFFDSKSVS